MGYASSVLFDEIDRIIARAEARTTQPQSRVRRCPADDGATNLDSLRVLRDNLATERKGGGVLSTKPA